MNDMTPQTKTSLLLLPRVNVRMTKSRMVCASKTFEIVFIILFSLINVVFMFKMIMPMSALIAPNTNTVMSIILVLSALLLLVSTSSVELVMLSDILNANKN